MHQDSEKHFFSRSFSALIHGNYTIESQSEQIP